MSTDHPKRRRRRRREQTALSGWLIPKDVKGNIGTISHDVFARLFPSEPSKPGVRPTDVCYVAVTLRSPFSDQLVENNEWTVLPVRARAEADEGGKQARQSSIHFPATSLALRRFVDGSRVNGSPIGGGKQLQSIEIWMLDVVPLALDTVYVTVDGDALRKSDEIQKRFGGGFENVWANGFAGKGKGKAKATIKPRSPAEIQDLDNRLTSAVREALLSCIVTREKDLLPLPFPAHPITHVPLPPGTIALCEPVAQGLLSDATKIIVNQVFRTDTTTNSSSYMPSQKAINGVKSKQDSGDEMANEHFYPAAQDGKSRYASEFIGRGSLSGSDASSGISDESSDDSLQDMITIDAPQRHVQMTSTTSSRTVLIPRTGGHRMNGVSTPGSVVSNVTTTTARHMSHTKWRCFKAKALLHKIPDEMLHPKPAPDEDDEARIFLDLKSLTKIGCFSGDWVQLQPAPPPSITGLELCYSSFDTFRGNDESADFKIAKVYGLSGISENSAPSSSRQTHLKRRSSVLSERHVENASPAAWMSPLLLANLSDTGFIRITPLLLPASDRDDGRDEVRQSKVNDDSSPPVAKEMTFLRICSPVATERALQAGIFAALKRHFEIKRRIVRQGDIIAFPIDVSTSRLVTEPAGSADADKEMEEIISLPSNTSAPRNVNLDVAWFKVGSVSGFESKDESPISRTIVWGGAACINHTTTRMRQAGSEMSRVLPTMTSSWQYYLGIRSPVKRLRHGTSLSQCIAPMPKQNVSLLQRRLRELVAVGTSPRALHLGMDTIAILLHSSQRGIGKATLAASAASDLGLHVFEIDAQDVLAEGGSADDIKTEALLRARMERANSCGPSCALVLLRHVDALSSDRTFTTLKELVPGVRAFAATTNDIESIPDGIRSLFTYELEVNTPDERQREDILHSIIEARAIRTARDVDLSAIALKSAALVAGDIVDIVDRATTAKNDRLERLLSAKTPHDQYPHQQIMRDVLISGGEQIRCITKADLDLAVEAARKNFADAIGAPKIPNVSWDDVGGLENVKDAVVETIQLPLERPEIFAKGMKKRSGILFYGPPGTGKTLLAKAIATDFSLNFFSVKGPELLNMYIGESEANVRRVFQKARDARPCVVFFDELDSVAPKRGNQGDSGGVMDRIVSQMLAELDGMSDGAEGGGGVFVIGATNRPDLLDQALLRPGRFDKMLYLGMSDTHEKQLTILEALTRKFTMHPDTSLQRIAEALPFTYTGADLYALCSDAMLKAIARQAAAVDVKIKNLSGGPVSTAYYFDHLATEDDIAVMVNEHDFSAAQRELVGSVR